MNLRDTPRAIVDPEERVIAVGSAADRAERQVGE
jgi:hypothetical protein